MSFPSAPDSSSPLRLFFALWPDAGVREQLQLVAREWRRAPGFRGRSIRPERYHITLAFLGDIQPGDELDRVFAVGASLRGAAFGLRLDRTGWFGRRQLIGWVGAGQVPEPLLNVQKQLSQRLQDADLPCDAKPFCPHVTLFRQLRLRPPRDLSVAVDWPVGEIVLVSSTLPPEPPEYLILNRYRLSTA